MSRRVVITGMGIITALGDSLSDFWTACLNGNIVVSYIPEHWKYFSNYKSQIWSELPPIDTVKHKITRLDRLEYDTVSILTLCAGYQAVTNSGIKLETNKKKEPNFNLIGIDPERVGVFMGTGSFGAHSFLETHSYQILAKPKKKLEELLYKLNVDSKELEEVFANLDLLKHAKRYNPFTVSRLMPNAISAVLGIRFSIYGPTNTVALACAAGTSAIGQAYRAIKDGYIDLAVAGGSEYWNDYYGGIFRGFDIANTLTHGNHDPLSANRPFDQSRTGFLFSQGGSAVLVLEELEHAISRDATILAEVVGFSESFDGHSMMSLAPDGHQIERMIRNAMSDASIKSEQVDYINAHGTGTVSNDLIECQVIKRIFGSKPKINSTKSLLGHTIGASGAIEAVVTVLSLNQQVTHVCKNLTKPIIDLNFVYEVENSHFEYALSHSFAFGGHNAGLIFKRYPL